MSVMEVLTLSFPYSLCNSSIVQRPFSFSLSEKGLVHNLFINSFH